MPNKRNLQMFLEGWGLHGVVGIMEWFTVHHVVDLMTDSQPVRNIESNFFLELLKKEWQLFFSELNQFF